MFVNRMQSLQKMQDILCPHNFCIFQGLEIKNIVMPYFLR